MDITWLGQACFRIKGKNATVVTDPYSDSFTGLKLPLTEADVVTVSHDHEDHNFTSAIKGDPFVLKGPGEYEVKGVNIVGVDSFHDDKQGSERGRNTVFNLEVDGVRIAHLGDLGHTLTNEQLEDLGDVDILLIPVGSVYTIDAALAAKISSSIEPKVIIPMHYKIEGLKAPLEGVEKFLKEMGKEDITPAPKLTITKEKLPEEPTIVLLEPAQK